MIKPILDAVTGLVSRTNKDVFLTPNIRALIRTHVKDPSRAQKLSEILDENEAMRIEFNKEKQARTTQFRKLQRNRDTTRYELESLLDQDLIEHQRLLNKFIRSRLKMQKLIQPQEWQGIVKDAAKKANQVFFDRQKVLVAYNETFKKLDAKAGKAIRDRERLREFRSILKYYWKQLAELQQARNVIPPRHPVLSNHNATEADLQEAVDELNHIRRTAYGTFVASHAKLVEIIPEKEWKKIF